MTELLTYRMNIMRIEKLDDRCWSSNEIMTFDCKLWSLGKSELTLRSLRDAYEITSFFGQTSD